MESVFSLTGKTILVTGASSGIGRAIAIQCAAYGATMLITGRNQERLNETLSLLNGEGHRLIIADIITEQGISELVGQLPQLNGVVHCAGVNTKSPLKFLSETKLDEIMKANFYAPALIMQSLLKQKKLLKQAAFGHPQIFGHLFNCHDFIYSINLRYNFKRSICILKGRIKFINQGYGFGISCAEDQSKWNPTRNGADRYTGRI